MSKSSRPQSGLGTIKRDWSTSSLNIESSQEILYHWPSSPERLKQQPAAPPLRKLTGAEQRLKDIQDALAGHSKPIATPPRELQPLVESRNALNKRPNPDAGSSTAPAPKKSRQLPPGWQAKDSLSKPSLPPIGSVSSSKPVTGTPSAVLPNSSTHTPTLSLNTSSSKSKVAPVFLSQEQIQILKLVEDGESVFYTGSAGTGKSVLLREIIKKLRKRHVKTPDAVAITASTGIAACNIGGVTIHSFAGIGLGIESAEDLASKVRKNKKALTRWLRTKVLIIDEVSMVDGDLFDKLARIGSILRKRVEPFGGIQVIVTGDFFQLPPVTKGNSSQVTFAFEAKFWSETIKRTFNLKKVFRQRDQRFVDMLNEMRFGTMSSETIRGFRALSREIEYDDGLVPTELFPRREDVERSNSTRISRLKTNEHRYIAQDGGAIQDENQKQKMLANFMAPQTLVLRVDAQVMLIKNTDDMLVNGSMGRVVRFADPAIYGTPADVGGVLGDAGFIGGAAVASSVGIGKQGKAKSTSTSSMLYPVVEFMLAQGGRRQMLVLPETWKVELPSGEVQVSRLQLPLILAWAMSIHKSQGQTLDRVKVDLGKVFEKGQAYVALSRATSLEGLQVLNFDPSKVNAHPKVVEWSRTLETIAES